MHPVPVGNTTGASGAIWCVITGALAPLFLKPNLIRASTAKLALKQTTATAAGAVMPQAAMLCGRGP